MHQQWLSPAHERHDSRTFTVPLYSGLTSPVHAVIRGPTHACGLCRSVGQGTPGSVSSTSSTSLDPGFKATSLIAIPLCIVWRAHTHSCQGVSASSIRACLPHQSQEKRDTHAFLVIGLVLVTVVGRLAGTCVLLSLCNCVGTLCVLARGSQHTVISAPIDGSRPGVGEDKGRRQVNWWVLPAGILM